MTLCAPFFVTCDDPSDTARFAARIGAGLRAGDVLLLQGDIGAGKTHFARALIQSLLPVPEDVPSPTYTLVQVYDGPACDIWHADLYRLTHPDEVAELGLTQAFTDAICLIEWPDRLGDLTPNTALGLAFEAVPGNDAARTITFDWHGDSWADRVAEWTGAQST